MGVQSFEVRAVEHAESSSRRVELLFRNSYEALQRLAIALTGDPSGAEELAQEAFARAWTHLEKVPDDAAARAYLRTTLVNLVRRSWRTRAQEIRHRLPGSHEPVEHDRTDRLVLLEALRRLPPRQRACVALRYLEDLSEQQTADALGVSVGTVKSTTHRALVRLEELMGDEDD